MQKTKESKMTAEQLLDKIRSRYFTEADEIKQDAGITFSQLSEYEAELISIVISDGNNALTEAIETYLYELKKEAE